MTDSVTFQSAPTTAEAPAQVTTPAAGGERPAWLPENFKTVEDFVRSATDTKAELTRAQQELATFKKPTTEVSPEKPAEGEKKPEAEKKPSDLEVPDGVDDKTKQELEKIDFAPYTQEFDQTGDITPENRVKIADSLKPIFGDDSSAIVNDYIEGAKTRTANARTEIMKVGGGEEQYAAMMQWAATGLSAEEKTAFNKAVTGGDFHTASFAVQGLKSKYEAVNGKAPTLINGDNGVANSGAAFSNIYEMVQAQKDPRYGKDPAYTKSVEERVKKSNF